MNQAILYFAFALTVVPAQAATLPAQEPATSELQGIVDDVVKRYDLPGIAVGVVQNGRSQIVVRGEQVVGSNLPITSNSLFKIASNTKAMTASVLARLVEAGKLRWDDPVSKYLPAFRMHDPWVSREIQVKDLLVHNSGLPEGGGDLMLWPEPNAFTRADILAGLAHIKPAYSFRAGYAYDNLLYVVAGEVAAAAGGATYEELVQREIFQPLDLQRCRVGEWNSDQVSDVAQPHTRRDGRNVVIKADGPVVPVLTSAAAGGIRCSLDDMLSWARNWLAPTPAQLDWLSAAQRHEAWVPRTPMPVSARRRDWDGSRLFAYGYGWRIADVDGMLTYSHTGTLSGMYSVMSLLPDQNAGFVVLINGDADDARTVLNEVLLKRFTRPGRGRSVAEVADALANESGTAAVGQAARPEALSRTQPGAAMRDQWGLYEDPWFGQVRICPQGQDTRFVAKKSPLLAGRVLLSGGGYVVDWDDGAVDAEAWLDFHPALGVGRARMTMTKTDPDADFSYDYEDLSFERVGACE